MTLETPLHGHRISSWLFLRLLALIYLIAFLSFWVQAGGLIGPNGILPLSPYLHAAAAQLPGSKFWQLPTLGWLNPDHPPVGSLALGGATLAVLLLFGLLPLPCLALCWLLYLSLVTDGRDFMGFQWDSLLLESGLAALLLAPVRLRSRLGVDPEPPRAARWLLYGLLFRLMLGSGVVKLSSGDPHWRDLSALTYHYWTQPLPLWTAWYANQLPLWFQKVCCLAVLALECGVPWLIPLPATRKAAFAVITALMLLIAGTGNYCFFNLLTVVLALLLLDDAAWPRRLRRFLDPVPPNLSGGLARPRVLLPILGAAFLFLLSLPPFLAQMGLRPAWPSGLLTLEEAAAPLRSVNTYGLFAVMTTERHEIVLEGSVDGRAWKEYEFPWKPGNVLRKPALAAPYQPRLDWQLWFAALGTVRDNPWFYGLCERLLQGSPEVLALLAYNPFPNSPPLYLRALLYDYHFSTPAERAATGAWWQRTLLGDYCPLLSLKPTPGVR